MLKIAAEDAKREKEAIEERYREELREQERLTNEKNEYLK